MDEQVKAPEVEEQVEVREATPEEQPELHLEEPTMEEAPAEEQQLSLNDLAVGYVVGMDQQGNFIFQVVGQQPGLVELLGIHSFAGERVKDLFNAKQGKGDPLVNEVGKAVMALHQKVDQLLNVIAPKKPDNEL